MDCPSIPQDVEKTMYSKEFLESLGLNPAIFDPDCEPAGTKPWCEYFEDKNPVCDDEDGILRF
jgi:hypothetical protein